MFIFRKNLELCKQSHKQERIVTFLMTRAVVRGNASHMCVALCGCLIYSRVRKVVECCGTWCWQRTVWVGQNQRKRVLSKINKRIEGYVMRDEYKRKIMEGARDQEWSKTFSLSSKWFPMLDYRAGLYERRGRVEIIRVKREHMKN